jgi:hypothetical protein
VVENSIFQKQNKKEAKLNKSKSEAKHEAKREAKNVDIKVHDCVCDQV